MAKFYRGQKVVYAVRGSAYTARVRKLHRDGSVTIEAMFYCENGREVGPYCGFEVRLYSTDLTPASSEAA